MWTATESNPFLKNTKIPHISGTMPHDEDRPTINILAMDTLLDQAYEWLCIQRDSLSRNNSVWDVRFNWRELKPPIQHQLLSGTYRLSPLKSYTINGELLSSWEAIDSLVLKALTITLHPLFTKEHYPHCMHLKNRGGIHEAVRQVNHNGVLCTNPQKWSF